MTGLIDLTVRTEEMEGTKNDCLLHCISEPNSTIPAKWDTLQRLHHRTRYTPETPNNNHNKPDTMATMNLTQLDKEVAVFLLFLCLLLCDVMLSWGRELYNIYFLNPLVDDHNVRLCCLQLTGGGKCIVPINATFLVLHHRLYVTRGVREDGVPVDSKFVPEVEI